MSTSKSSAFLPSKYGFKFGNSFPSRPDIIIHMPFGDIGVGDASNGLCGGMVYTALDYFYDHQVIPLDSTPPNGGPLFDHIAARLFDSFDLPGGVMKYLDLMNPMLPDHETAASQARLAPHGRAWRMIREEWPLIKANIDAGRPSALGLVCVKSADPTQLGKNHQVLAYGYDLNGDDLTLCIYDPNVPNDDSVTLRLNIGEPEHTTQVTYSTGRTVHAFFQTSYTPKPPPLTLIPGFRLWDYDAGSPADCLPGDPVGQGQWATIRGNHVLVPMHDGKVLDWVPEDGSWRLWDYDAGSPADCLPGDPVGQGQWATIRGNHVLVPMHDGKVLDWVPEDGSWRLWNYDAGSPADCLPGDPVGQGQWATIRGNHVLVPMHDGKVLDWVPEDGSWQLWNYDAGSPADCLPGDPVGQGQWATIRGNHVLVPMHDGRVLDWVPEDGSWRLWNYDAGSPTDCLPGDPVGQGQWATIRGNHVLVPMHDGRVLDWIP